VEAKLKEIGGLVKAMELTVKPEAASLKDGALVPAENGPVKLEGTASLHDALFHVKRKVDAHSTEQAAIQQDIRAHKLEKDLASMAKDREKAGEGADAASGKSGSLPVNAYTEKLAGNLDKAMQSVDQMP
jgi:hypothetical protein